MLPLWHAGAGGRRDREPIPLNDHDRSGLLGCGGGEQSGKASADHDDARPARLHGLSQPGSRGKLETPVVRCCRGPPGKLRA